MADDKKSDKTNLEVEGKVAVVRVRGIRNIKPKIRKTFELLRLDKPNQCVLVNGNPKLMGMINIVKDYVAYGVVSSDTIYKLIKKRGEKGGKLVRTLFEDDELKSLSEKIFLGAPVNEFVNQVFRLHPPRSGYKNIKKAYPLGDLGKRDDMNRLVLRMI